ncbi:Spy/CpxP family protein refolding chaperone [Kaarinaea lacus]
MTNWFIRRIRKKLQLNDSQQAKLITFSNTIDSSRSYVADVQKDRGITLDDIFSDNGFDRDSALHYLNVPRLAFEEQAPAVVDALGEFYQCLNQQQQEQLRAMLQKYHQHQKRRCWH